MRTDQTIKNRYTVTSGVLEYAVTFPLYEETDVAVWLSSDGGRTERLLTLRSDYRVSIGSGGGRVGLMPGVAAAGDVLALVSALPYTQELDLSGTATISTGQTEMQLDRTTQQIQQLAERIGRNLYVPVTSSKSADEVMQEIFGTVATANVYAEKTEQMYRDLVALREKTEALIVATGDAQTGRVVEEGDRQVGRVAEEGERQRRDAAEEADRAERAADMAGLTHAISCAGEAVVLEKDVPAGTCIDLPAGLTYLVGRHHLRLCYDGVSLSPHFFEEVGERGAVSRQVRLLLPLAAGQELDFWIIPLGEAGEILEEVPREDQALAAGEGALGIDDGTCSPDTTRGSRTSASEISAAMGDVPATLPGIDRRVRGLEAEQTRQDEAIAAAEELARTLLPVQTDEAGKFLTTDGESLHWGSVESFPSGTRMLFHQAAAPAGWIRETSIHDAALRVVSGETGGGTGGGTPFSTLFAEGQAVSLSGAVGETTLSVAQMPGHTHSGRLLISKSRGEASGDTKDYSTDNAWGGMGSSGGGGSHTHSFSGTASIALAVKYTDIIICTKE